VLLPEAGTLIPVRGKDVYFVLAPSAGIETLPENEALGDIGQLAAPMHAQLIDHGAGVWIFKWHRPSNVRTVRFRTQPTTLAAWTLSTAAGRYDLQGSERLWHVGSVDTRGYIVYGDYWSRPTGDYVARVELSTKSAVNVEVWNATNSQLLARRVVTNTEGPVEVEIPFDYTHALSQSGSFGGFGPFSAHETPPESPLDQLEIRVWGPGDTSTEVFSVSLNSGLA
jgi:hypothetical protein